MPLISFLKPFQLPGGVYSLCNKYVLLSLINQEPSVPSQVPIYPSVERSNNSQVSRSGTQVSWPSLQPTLCWTQTQELEFGHDTLQHWFQVLFKSQLPILMAICGSTSLSMKTWHIPSLWPKTGIPWLSCCIFWTISLDPLGMTRSIRPSSFNRSLTCSRVLIWSGPRNYNNNKNIVL